MAVRFRPTLTNKAWQEVTRFTGAVELVSPGTKQKRIDKARRRYDRMMRSPWFGLFGGGNLTLEGFRIGGDRAHTVFIVRCSDCGRFIQAPRMELLSQSVQCCNALSLADLELHTQAMATNAVGGNQLIGCTGTPRLDKLITRAAKLAERCSPTLKRQARGKTWR